MRNVTNVDFSFHFNETKKIKTRKLAKRKSQSRIMRLDEMEEKALEK